MIGGDTYTGGCSVARLLLYIMTAQRSTGLAGLCHLSELHEGRSVAALGSLLSTVRRLRRVRRGGTRGAVIAAGLTLAGVVGETKGVGGERHRGASAGAGTRASLRAMGGDGSVTGAAAQSAGFLGGAEGSNLGTGQAAVPLAATHIKIGGVRESHLEIADVAGPAGSHGSGSVSCWQGSKKAANS